MCGKYELEELEAVICGNWKIGIAKIYLEIKGDQLEIKKSFGK